MDVAEHIKGIANILADNDDTSQCIKDIAATGIDDSPNYAGERLKNYGIAHAAYAEQISDAVHKQGEGILGELEERVDRKASILSIMLLEAQAEGKGYDFEARFQALNADTKTDHFDTFMTVSGLKDRLIVISMSDIFGAAVLQSDKPAIQVSALPSKPQRSVIPG